MKKWLKTLIYALLSIAILAFLYHSMDGMTTKKEISYSEFLQMTEHGDIEKVIINGDTLKIYPYDSNTYYETEYIEDSDFVDYLTEQEVVIEKQAEKQTSIFSVFLTILIYLLPFFILLCVILVLFGSPMQGQDNSGVSNIFNAGKNKGKLYKEDDTKVTFADVAGQEEAKESLVEIIDYLHNSEKYRDIGAKLPKGALLVGPPGTGKTLLAKSVAGEAGVPFFSLTGSDFVEMFVGVGASRVRDLFQEAKKNAPCIIFIDEIDAIGKSRGSGARASGNDEREQTLNQLLSEMDGFDSNKAIVVLAATNRPEILDKALLRPGRFDRRIIVDRPDLKGREAVLKVHAKDVCVDETVDFTSIAQATAGAVGADLANIINEAALRAVKMKRKAISQEDLMESVETVFAGKEKKDRIMTEEERKIVAYHEVGHAVIAALQKNSAPVQKITIVPRTMGSLGYTMQVPEEEKYLSSKEEMLEEIRTLIGGRCAEEIFFNKITTGASNDIEKVTSLARKMICTYGMADEFDMLAFETIGNYYLEDEPIRNCSEKTSSLIDELMISTVSSCHKEVKKMLNSNKELVHELAEFLLFKENITGEEFMEIFRKYHPDASNTKKTNKKAIVTEKQKEEISMEQKEKIDSEVVKEELPVDNIDVGENSFEEPIPIEEDIPLDFSTEEVQPIDDIPMPDFEFPFSDDIEDDKKSESKQPEKKTETKNEAKKDTESKPVFEAPKPLQKKKGKKNKNNNQNNNQNNKNNQSLNQSSEKNEKNNEEKQSDLDLLMNGLKNNPQELAQKNKNGVYVQKPKKEQKKNNSNILSPDSKPEDLKKDEMTEDDY